MEEMECSGLVAAPPHPMAGAWGGFWSRLSWRLGPKPHSTVLPTYRLQILNKRLCLSPPRRGSVICDSATRPGPDLLSLPTLPCCGAASTANPRLEEPGQGWGAGGAGPAWSGSNRLVMADCQVLRNFVSQSTP